EGRFNGVGRSLPTAGLVTAAYLKAAASSRRYSVTRQSAFLLQCVPTVSTAPPGQPGSLGAELVIRSASNGSSPISPARPIVSSTIKFRPRIRLQETRTRSPAPSPKLSSNASRIAFPVISPPTLEANKPCAFDALSWSTSAIAREKYSSAESAWKQVPCLIHSCLSRLD